MPMYDFVCAKCGHRFEELLPMDQKDRVRCPKCQSAAQRVYEGACNFGRKAGCGSSCSGSCKGCAGCASH